MIKSDFPIFAHNPGLVYLDNAASTQKPQIVIDGVSEFLAHDYANIHRGLYSLSEKSEEIYHTSKEAVAEFIGCTSSEIIYTYNSTYGINLVAQSLVKSKFLKSGDVVLLGIWDHHANILPWQVLAQEYGFTIKFIHILDDYTIDRDDFQKKYDEKVKVVALAQVSNVTGKIYDVQQLSEKLREETFFLVDGSQSVPNFPVNVRQIDCDCLVFTGHKMMAYTGIGVVYLKREYIKNLTPMILGGGTIEDVATDSYTLSSTVDKFEAGTPNIIGAVSLLKALEYIKSLGGIQSIREHEQKIVRLCLKKFSIFKEKVEILGPLTMDRVAVFSMLFHNNKNFNIIGEYFASKNICIRCGGHCAHLLHKFLHKGGTCRMSAYVYNDEADIETFFNELEKIIQ